MDTYFFENALAKRQQLLRDGYCVGPGILHGDLLERVRRFSDDFLDTHAVDPCYRYQGSDFHIQFDAAWSVRKDENRYPGQYLR